MEAARRPCGHSLFLQEVFILTKTEHYQLNQWQKTDRVLMEDFNSDNAKIDAALAAVPPVKLLDLVTESPQQQVDISLAEFSPEPYAALKLYICAKVSSLLVRVNNRTNYYGAGNFGGAEGQINVLATSAGASFPAWMHGELTLLFSPVDENNWLVSAFLLSGNSNKVDGSRGTCVLTGALQTLNLLSGDSANPIPAGSRFRLYGIRK